MEALKFLKEADRMCKTINKDCAKCGLFQKYNGICIPPCKNFIKDFPEQSVKIVEAWSNANPEKTIRDKVLEVFPNADIVSLCPCQLGFSSEVENCNAMYDSCDDCWNRSLSEVENE